MRRHRQRFFPLTVLLFSIGYASFGISKAVLLLVGPPLALVLSPFPRAKAWFRDLVTRRYLGFFSRKWLPFLGAYRVAEIRGLEKARLASPAIYVANHRGFMDSILLLGLLPRTGVMIKASDARQPTYAFLEKHFDLIAVDKNSLPSITHCLARCKALLGRGGNLLVFPEGRRARSGRLQHFNRVAFDLAMVARVPVVPVVVHSTQPFMARLPGSIFVREPNDYCIRFLAAEAPRPGEKAESLCDRVHRRMARELQGLDRGTVWERTLPAHEAASGGLPAPEPGPEFDWRAAIPTTEAPAKKP